MNTHYTLAQLSALQLMLTRAEYQLPSSEVIKKIASAFKQHKMYTNPAGLRCMLTIMFSDGQVNGFFWQLSMRNASHSHVSIDAAAKELQNVGEGSVERMYNNIFIKKLSAEDLAKAESLRSNKVN